MQWTPPPNGQKMHNPIPDALRNKHAGQVAIILGTGPSLKDYDLDDPFFTENVTFGSNAIGKVFAPTYYVVTDPRSQEVWARYIRKIDNKKTSVFLLSSYVWNQYHGLKSPRHLIYYRGRDRIGPPNNQKIYNGRTTGIVMLHIAYMMGFKYIFLLGIDGYHAGPGSSHFYDDHKEGRGRSDKRSDWVVQTCLVQARKKLFGEGKFLYNLGGRSKFRTVLPSWWEISDSDPESR